MHQTFGARWIIGGIWLGNYAHGQATNAPKSSPEHFVFVASYKYFLCWHGGVVYQLRRYLAAESIVVLE